MASAPVIEPVVIHAQMPPGVLGPDAATLEVRCFLVPTNRGIVLVDAGLPGTSGVTEGVLGRIGGRWSDVTDIVLTHSHFDHVGGLAEIVALAPRAAVWAGANDIAAIPSQDTIGIRPLVEGDRIGELGVLETPGHTAGHVSLLHESGSVVLVGDLVGSVDGALSFGPPAFTVEPARSRASLERVVSMGMSRLMYSHGAEVSEPNDRARELLQSTAAQHP